MHNCVEGNKRQLPPWMMKKADASIVSNSTSVVETKFSTENGETIASNVRKEDQNKETSKRKSNLNAKCEVKGRKKLGQQNGSGDNITQKKKEKSNRCRDRAPSLRSSVKKRKNLEELGHDSSDEVHPVEASSEDELELTVEDLVAIAEQYVKDYEKEREKTSRQCESNWQLPATTEAGITLDSPCENKKSSSSEMEALHSSSPTTGEVIPRSIIQTGNPAQDMLDLLLGPLLRNTIEKDEKSKSSVESVKIADEFIRQSQNEIVEEEMVPLVKKRNTLKDKVAMLLH